jgi:N-acetylneuraminate synthase|tara:strand:+ start:79 stop:1128 length:1050 start_codon:yes stop_codon:yes gene_type:complete
MNSLVFGNLKLYKYKPTIIAEVGVNHNCNLTLAKKYIKLCKEAGADAVKFQTYKAEKIAAKISPAYWDLEEEKTKSQYKLFKKYDKFNYKEYKALFDECYNRKIKFMSTFFDLESIDEYEKLIKVFKISSSDINNYPLLKKISSKKKHTIISTGASDINEIKRAIKILNLPKEKICLMHCVLNYPTEDKFANLKFIKTLKDYFPGIMMGYSDHVKSDNTLTQLQVAYEFGAQIIEKHFSHNKRLKGNDHYHAMDEDDLSNFQSVMERKKILTGSRYKKLSNEAKSIKYARRAIYAKKNIKKFSKIQPKNIIALRPAIGGISVADWNNVVGKKVKKEIKEGNIIKKNFLI